MIHPGLCEEDMSTMRTTILTTMIATVNATMSPGGGGTPTPAAPLFVIQPQDTSVVEGQTATFIAVATGSPSPTYEWQTGAGTPLGATGTFIRIVTTLDLNGNTYKSFASNTEGNDTSDIATLTVTQADYRVGTGLTIVAGNL
jgi:hypothetical protein